MVSSIPAFWIPFIIFFARICDVSLGTLRIVFVSKGMRLLATILGFLEILIWVFVIAQLISHLNNWVNYLAYAGGFATGTYLGLFLEKKLKVGTVLVRIIIPEKGNELIKILKNAGFMFTRVGGEGSEGSVEIIFTIIKLKYWDKIKKAIESFDSDAFYSVEEIKFTSGKDDRLSQPAPHLSKLLRVRKGI